MSELGVIPDGSLLVRDGILVEVGPTRRVENLAEARGAVEINAAGRVLMPGFVDSHTHLAFPSGAKGPADGARVVRQSNAQRLEIRLRSYLEAMARHGATTVEVKTGCGLDEGAESKILRVLAGLRTEPIEVSPTFLLDLPELRDEDAGAAAEMLAALLSKIKKRKLAGFLDLAWNDEPGFAARAVRWLEIARLAGLERKVHAASRSCRAAVEAAVAGFAVSVDHLEYAGAEEIGTLAGSGAVATLMPAASFHAGIPYAPGRALIDAGVPVALASNFHPDHTPALNPQTVTCLAAMGMGLTAEEAITAATINGAHALGLAGRTGSLEPGKQADLILLNISDYRELTRRMGVNLVHLTMKRGEIIYREGEVARPNRTPHAVMQT